MNDIPGKLVPLDRRIAWARRMMTGTLNVQLISAVAFWLLRDVNAFLVMVACIPVLFAAIGSDWWLKANFRKQLIVYWVSLGISGQEAREKYAERYW
jgi:hypothetical protein